MKFRVIGPGRAGGSFADALSSVGWSLDAMLGRTDDVRAAGNGVDVVLVAVPDREIAHVAQHVAPGDAVLVHVAGSQQLAVLAPHAKVGSIHPLMALPDRRAGARLLLDHCRFAVAGDPITERIARDLGGHPFPVAEDRRMAYHAAGAVASNHLVALMGHVQALAERAGVPRDTYWQLMAASMQNVIDSDPASALTGPASRGDWDTVRGHLAALEPTDRMLYLPFAREAARLAGQQVPPDLDDR